MAYNARVFRILVASPSDVEEERTIVAEVIQEWNYLNSEDTGAVLFPIRWETHSSPELGERPQAVINRQIVDTCDMLVGVFWTRLGTSTGIAASGTVEEIERISQAGKIVMLYFSRARADLDAIDLDEYRKLKEFREATYPRGLVESYNSTAEFRDKLSRQLTMKFRDLRARDSKVTSADRLPDSGSIVLGFASGEPPQILPAPGSIEVENVVCVNEDEIPDYHENDLESSDAGKVVFINRISLRGRHYYRSVVEQFKIVQMLLPIRIAMRNSADIGIRDIYMDLVLSAKGGRVKILEQMPTRPGEPNIIYNYKREVVAGSLDIRIEERENFWEMKIDFPSIQAKRTILSANTLYLGSSEPAVITLSGTVYSSTSTPIIIEASLEIKVKERRMTYQQILSESGVHEENI